MAAKSVHDPLFAVLVQQQAGNVICTLQAVRYSGGAFAAAPHQPPDLFATAIVESSAAGMTTACSRRVDDGWDNVAVTDPAPGAALWALLDLTAQSQADIGTDGAPIYIVYRPTFDVPGDGTLTRRISLRITQGHDHRMTPLGHVDETYLGYAGRRIDVRRYRYGNPKRATRIRITDPGTDSLLVTEHALDRLVEVHHGRPGFLPQRLRRARPA
jgi:hypothetical protein